MSKNAELQQRRVDAVARGVGNATQLFAVKAENALIWDADGRRYIDFAGGIGVMNTGHRHPKVMARIQKQLEGVVHSCFQVMPYEPYIELAEELNKRAPIAGKAKTLFVTTGAEAVENAVKIARAYTKRPGVIAFGGGYHGRTLLTLGLTGKVAPYKIGFGPFPADIFHARFPHPYHGVTVEDTLQDITNLFKYDIEPSRVAAFIIEPVIGEGGFVPTPPELMRALRALCDEHGILLIADEVQSGFARTGKLYAMEHFDVKADLITTAKSLAGGMPLSGVIGRAEVIDAPAAGGLGGTYGGNPVACAAALGVLEVIDSENILQRSTELGAQLAAFVNNLAKEPALGIGEVRHLGAMFAFELIKPGTANTPDADAAKALTAKAAELGLILLSCGVYANSIRVLVPITIEPDILQEALAILEKALRAVRG
ncbi:4-aminobutyrate transaminase [Arenimonas maotaiensis]|uniref:4-aminobutyrate transaminase n=1 Tax=Arenimonas maotaiensis TaxID=1446479 RepID=A0A917CEA3_9GAMM|nr:4-aminobutyrate--2-oxoglutarate transaminase [Arenimonas maotaiensis]GGF84756.1 4-aminobutyrate transaminase [Arenimonas maotaiensis]